MPWPRPYVASALVAMLLSAAACTSESGTVSTAEPKTTASAHSTPPATPASSAPAATSATAVTSTTTVTSTTDATSAAAATSATASPASATPTAHAVGLEPQVGPLFGSTDAQPHNCSASVIHSPGHDLIVTAAHCLSGTGAGQLFAPDYRDGTEPFGTWRVLRAWVSPGWMTKTDPDLDVAVLQVGPRTVNDHLEQVEDVVGAETLGTTPAPGARVTVVGYTHGIDDRQITCTNILGRTNQFPSFSCHGYVGGTSGSPFLTAARPRVIVGLVGGLNLGGCTEAVSYSPPFGAAVAALLARAVAGDAAQSLPTATSNC